MVDDVRVTLSRLLAEDAEQQLGAAVRDALRPALVQAFREGFRAGIEAAKNVTERGFEMALRAGDQAARNVVAHREHGEAVTDSRPGRRRRGRRRVASGTLRALVEMILADQPGLRVAEVQATAVTIDNTIAPTSIGNELRRNENTRYRRDGKRWFLIGDPKQVPGLARGNAMPEPETERGEVVTTTSSSSVGQAA